MPNFKYEAIDAKGNKVRDTLEAVDRADAMAQIKARSLFPTKVKKSKAPPTKVKEAPAPPPEQSGYTATTDTLEMDRRLSQAYWSHKEYQGIQLVKFLAGQGLRLSLAANDVLDRVERSGFYNRVDRLVRTGQKTIKFLIAETSKKRITLRPRQQKVVVKAVTNRIR